MVGKMSRRWKGKQWQQDAVQELGLEGLQHYRQTGDIGLAKNRPAGRRTGCGTIDWSGGTSRRPSRPCQCPEIGKSWLVLDLGLAAATGWPSLETFACEPGDVLIIDNELHWETTAHAIPREMEAGGIPPQAVGERRFVASVRGRIASHRQAASCISALTCAALHVTVDRACQAGRELPFMAFGPDGGKQGAISSVG